jgi:FemAB family protein
MKIIAIKDSDFKGLKCSYFPDKALHPLYSSLSNEFYTEYFLSHNSKFEDISCIIFDEKQAYCLIGMTIDICRDNAITLGFYGLPSYYQEYKELSTSQKKQVQKLLGKYIEDTIFSLGVNKIIFLDANPSLSPMALALLKKGCSPSIKLMQNIDLNQSMSDIRKGFRKGHKAAINWAIKNINARILSSKDISWSDMEKFRNLHIQASGRETRSEKTWRIQHDMIKNNEAFAVFGDKDGILVTAALFQYSNKSCYYSISASNRKLFDKPISHILIWKAIEQAKLLNCKIFEVGEQVYDSENRKKESNIADFKRGFGGNILSQTVISK